MKHVMVLIMVLAAGMAIADEKTPDTSEFTMDAGTRIQITGELGDASPIWDRSFGFGDPAPTTCDFPFDASSITGQYYDFFCIESTDENPISIAVDPAGTTIGDTTLYLFCDPFDPSMPTSNGAYYDDDGGEGLLSAFLPGDNVILPPGTEYWLVISTFSAGDSGTFAIDTSDNVALCGGVAVEQSDWSSFKGLFE